MRAASIDTVQPAGMPGSTGRLWRSLMAALLTVSFVTAMPSPAMSAEDPDRTFVVDRAANSGDPSPWEDDTTDAAPGDGVCADADGRCSLRAAVMEANALGGHTIVRFHEDLEDEDGQVFVPLVTSGFLDDTGALGDLDVVADVRLDIVGDEDPPAEAPQLGDPVRLIIASVFTDAIGSAHHDRGFHVLPDGELNLSDVVLVSFRALTDGASTARALGGGVLVDHGTFTAERVAIFQTEAFAGPVEFTPASTTGEARGGAIFADGGVVTLRDVNLLGTRATAADAADIDASVTEGGGAFGGAIAGSGGSTVTLERVTVEGAAARAGAGLDSSSHPDTGGVGGTAFGGAIHIDGGTVLQATDVEVLGARATGGWGGNGHGSSATPTNGGRGGAAYGGGIYVEDADAHLDRVTFAGSTFGISPTTMRAEGGRGGIGGFGDGVDGADGGDGGAAYGGAVTWAPWAGVVSLQNVTISGSEAIAGPGRDSHGSSGGSPGATGDDGSAWGGGIVAAADGVILNTTVADTVTTGVPALGGVVTYLGGSSSTVTGSLMADNVPTDCNGPITSGGGNVDTDGSCALGGDDVSGGTAALAPLTDAGGFVAVRPLSSGSDAVDRDTVCLDIDGADLGMDARGAPRPADAVCDAGAFERHTVPLLEFHLDPVTVAEGESFPATVRRIGATAGDIEAPLLLAGDIDLDDLDGITDPVAAPTDTTEVDLTVTAVDDIRVEPDETALIALDPDTTTGAVVSLLVNGGEVTILDDDVPLVVDRLAGDSRVETAVAVSEHTYPGGAPVVLVARADQYPDALAGAPLAAHLGAPILLTPSTRLHDAVAAEVTRLGASDAILLGGEAALTGDVAAALDDLGLDVERVAGVNRYETSVAIAERLLGDSPSGTTAYLTEGANADPARGWPDALSVSGLAAAHGRPILLTLADALPSTTASALTSLDVTDLTVVGGEAAVSAAVFAEADDLVADVDRVSGPSRYATSAAVADLAVAEGASAGTVYAATGLSFPDALVAGPTVAATNSVLLLVHGRDASRSPDSTAWLSAHDDQITAVHVLGGVGAVAQEVLDAIVALLTPA